MLLKLFEGFEKSEEFERKDREEVIATFKKEIDSILQKATTELDTASMETSFSLENMEKDILTCVENDKTSTKFQMKKKID